MPSLGNPLYKAVVKTTSGQEYDLYKLKVILDLTISDDPDSLAKEVSLTVMNAAKNGVTLATLIQPSDRLYIYANVGCHAPSPQRKKPAGVRRRRAERQNPPRLAGQGGS
jgi:hypothetical protein